MLRPDTERLWNFLKDQQSLGGFVLVGGTALSMHLGHRLSEDLDFMIAATRLPRATVELLKRLSASAGFPFVANDSPAALDEFEDTGMDYHDYQQDFVVAASVKLTLVAPILKSPCCSVPARLVGRASPALKKSSGSNASPAPTARKPVTGWTCT